jgi:hypothetical protein
MSTSRGESLLNAKVSSARLNQIPQNYPPSQHRLRLLDLRWPWGCRFELVEQLIWEPPHAVPPHRSDSWDFCRARPKRERFSQVVRTGSLCAGVFPPPEQPLPGELPSPTFTLCLDSRWYATGRDTGWRQSIAREF